MEQYDFLSALLDVTQASQGPIARSVEVRSIYWAAAAVDVYREGVVSWCGVVWCAVELQGN